MKAFIQAHGVYLGFWVLMWALSLVGAYWAVRWAVLDAIRVSGLQVRLH